MNKIIIILSILLTQINAISQTNLEIDEKAPEITITNWFNNIPENKELKGKYIVLDFWATWCDPCIKSVGHLNSLKNKYKNILFLSLSDENEVEILKTINKINFETIVVSDSTKKTFENYKSELHNEVLRPSTVLIDDKGIIKWVGYTTLLNEKILDDFLMNKLKSYNYFTTSKFKKDLNENEDKRSILDFKVKLEKELNNPILNEFIFVEKSDSQYGINGYEDLNNKVMLFGHKDFKYLYSKVTNKSANEFIIDESITKEKYNFCMIHRTDNYDNLEKQFLEKLNLKKEIITKEINFYDLTIDFNKLGEGKLEEGQIKSIQDNNNRDLKYTNYSINELISDLNTRFSLRLSIKSVNNKVYDFKFLTQKREEIFKSLENYGFNILKSKRIIEIFKINKIK